MNLDYRSRQGAAEMLLSQLSVKKNAKIELYNRL